MKNVGAILFLVASAGSFVTGTPAFSHEKRAVAQPAEIAARALELSPPTGALRKVNGTENVARSLGLENANSTLGTGAQKKARSLFIRRDANSTDENEKRSPSLRRAHLNMPALNGTEA
ncbi:hypothetical protein F5Y06DRAFT_275043 [Hypoxylon sp. FL0890]|nr:hypothetical protein F5Y06DRAFT_275043 [Hypoxylon sp. FL0890]